jgi:hypothetical protein
MPTDLNPAVMSSVTPAAGPIHLGLDTSKNTIVVGVLMPGAAGLDGGGL